MKKILVAAIAVLMIFSVTVVTAEAKGNPHPTNRNITVTRGAEGEKEFSVMMVSFRNFSQFTTMLIPPNNEKERWMEDIYAIKGEWRKSSDDAYEYIEVKILKDGKDMNDSAFITRGLKNKGEVMLLSTYYFSHGIDKNPLPKLFPVEVVFPTGEKIKLRL